MYRTQRGTWRSQGSAAAHCDIRCEGIIREEMISSTKKHVTEQVMPEQELEGSERVC